MGGVCNFETFLFVPLPQANSIKHRNSIRNYFKLYLNPGGMVTQSPSEPQPARERPGTWDMGQLGQRYRQGNTKQEQ